MNLVIVESPTKAKTLSKILSKDYKIEASRGHIRDLPKSGLGVNVDKNFEPEYVIPEGANKTISKLKKEAKDAEKIILATDPDREGEAIAWHLEYLLTPKKGKKPEFERAVFHELTEEAIKHAFDTTGEIDMNLVDAQQARRVLDRLVGYKLSPLLWKKVMFGLSAGRVQSVAVRLIVDREREREAFVPEEYWSVKADFASKNGDFSAELTYKDDKKIEVTNNAQAEKIVSDLKEASFVIKEVNKTERRKYPVPPFKTSTLQATMSNSFGFTANRTMRAAQKLFEKGFITYHRTDSTNLSQEFVSTVRNFIKNGLSGKYLPDEAIVYKNKSKNAQEAHEAIRPTDLDRKMPKNITDDESKVYLMILNRSVSCQMNPAIYDQTSVRIDSNNNYAFKANGSVIKFDGFYAVSKLTGFDSNGAEKSEILPVLQEGEKVDLKLLTPEQHFTQPPGRYSDATLIKAMEDLGIGRPSTYAPTLSTIQGRKYVVKENRYFIPQDVAFVVNDILVEHFPEIVDFSFTAGMEESLDEVAEGKVKWEPVIKEFFGPFEKKLALADKALDKHSVTNLGDSDETCPDCGSKLIFKLGKYGKFLSCSNYPECKYAKPISGGATEEEQNADYGKCTNCDEGIFILKQGRFGKFLACSNYPKCKTTQPFLEKIGMNCPKCSEGEVVVKKAKGRTFYGCSKYPDCDYSSWKNPMPQEEITGISSENNDENSSDEVSSIA